MQAVLPKARIAGLAGLLAAALAAAVLLLVLTGAQSHPRAAVASVGGPPAPAASYDGTLGGARCEQWEAAGPAARLNAVRGIAGTVGGASTTGGVGTTLSESRAFGLFDRVCRTPGSRGFTLYLLYAQAAAFSRVHVSGP